MFQPERVELLGFDVTFLTPDDVQVAVLAWEAPPGAAGIPVHVHERTEEGFFVVRGELGLLLDGRELIRPAGSYTLVRPGQAHAFWNAGAEPAVFLTPIAPPGVATYLRALAAGLASARTPEEAAALRAELATRHDITVVGPPPRP